MSTPNIPKDLENSQIIDNASEHTTSIDIGAKKPKLTLETIQKLQAGITEEVLRNPYYKKGEPAMAIADNSVHINAVELPEQDIAPVDTSVLADNPNIIVLDSLGEVTVQPQPTEDPQSAPKASELPEDKTNQTAVEPVLETGKTTQTVPMNGPGIKGWLSNIKQSFIPTLQHFWNNEIWYENPWGNGVLPAPLQEEALRLRYGVAEVPAEKAQRHALQEQRIATAIQQLEADDADQAALRKAMHDANNLIEIVQQFTTTISKQQSIMSRSTKEVQQQAEAFDVLVQHIENTLNNFEQYFDEAEPPIANSPIEILILEERMNWIIDTLAALNSRRPKITSSYRLPLPIFKSVSQRYGLQTVESRISRFNAIQALQIRGQKIRDKESMNVTRKDKITIGANTLYNKSFIARNPFLKAGVLTAALIGGNYAKNTVLNTGSQEQVINDIKKVDLKENGTVVRVYLTPEKLSRVNHITEEVVVYLGLDGNELEQLETKGANTAEGYIEAHSPNGRILTKQDVGAVKIATWTESEAEKL